MKTIGKTACAVLAAILVLDVFAFFYYNPPSHLQESTRATDTIRLPGAFTSRATEGAAASTIDSNGYNNPSVPGEDGVSVLMMGSSHTEGLNLPQTENASCLLGQMLSDDGVPGMVYNIGISSHQLYRNAANLSHALDRFQPSTCVVIESYTVVLTASQIAWAQTDTTERLPATSSALPGFVSERPIVRALYNQWNSAHGMTQEDILPDVVTPDMLGRYEDALVSLFVRMKAASDAHGVRLILYYHPHLILQPDGSAKADTDEGCLAAFRSACDRTGITFLDMTDRFLTEYQTRHVLPHGFFNTTPGTGHLNRYGQAMVAESLYRLIREVVP